MFPTKPQLLSNCMAILLLSYTLVGFPCNNKAILSLTYTMVGFTSKKKTFYCLLMVGFPNKSRAILVLEFSLTLTRPRGESILRHSICNSNTLTTWPSLFIGTGIIELIFLILTMARCLVDILTNAGPKFGIIFNGNGWCLSAGWI